MNEIKKAFLSMASATYDDIADATTIDLATVSDFMDTYSRFFVRENKKWKLTEQGREEFLDDLENDPIFKIEKQLNELNNSGEDFVIKAKTIGEQITALASVDKNDLLSELRKSLIKITKEHTK